MDSITVTIAVYEHIRFGYRTVFQQEVSAGVEAEGNHVRISEWQTVTLPGVTVDLTAQKLAALDVKAGNLKASLQQVEREKADLVGSTDAERLQEAADAANEAAAEERLLGGAA